MSQNTSSAVMQQRSKALDSLDFFPTPPWATRALMEHVIIPQLGLFGRKQIKDQVCWEPAAGHGDMARPLEEYFGYVLATDIHDHGDDRVKHLQHDFLMPYWPGPIEDHGAHWIITNPPFQAAERFIEQAMRVPHWQGTAMLVRVAFLEGIGRWHRLFNLNPPTIVAQFTERVPLYQGRLAPEGRNTATAYCWLVWMANADRRPMLWIPPCRKALERDTDYGAAL